MNHNFLFQSGVWLGEGEISFSASSDIINFFTRWKIFHSSENEVRAVQHVERRGIKEPVINYIDITEIHPESFKIRVSNDLMDPQEAQGVLSLDKISWAFYGNGELRGFEEYQLQPNGEYFFHAEYPVDKLNTTFVNGRLWLKALDE
jgi:hypothetical protein